MPRPIEKWKPIKGAANYLISSWGRVYSLGSKKFMKAYIHKSRANTYLRVSIRKKKHMVHVLVADHFMAHQKNMLQEIFPEEKLQVNHLDRNTLNCNLSNLNWETESENKIHMHKTNKVFFGGKFV